MSQPPSLGNNMYHMGPTSAAPPIHVPLEVSTTLNSVCLPNFVLFSALVLLSRCHVVVLYVFKVYIKVIRLFYFKT